MGKTIYLIPERRSLSNSIGEKNSSFSCPSGTVMTGRWHRGDENGQTQYEYATLKAIYEDGSSASGQVTVEDVREENGIKESSHGEYNASTNRVIVGRKHYGDENGNTVYITAVVKYNGIQATVTNGVQSQMIKESAGIWFNTDSRRVITGRYHLGDENGMTYYKSAELRVFIDTTEKAPEGTTIVPDRRTESTYVKESSGSAFICPAGTVMTGRIHLGDENEQTAYEYATLKAIDKNGKPIEGEITIKNIEWSPEFQESYGRQFDAPFGRVIVGRKHSGDENGKTSYATGEVFFNGHPTTIINYKSSAPKKESDAIWFKTEDKYVLTSRHHYGDENGTTYYGYGMISCDEPEKSKEKIILRVKMHSEEEYFPMNPNDFVRLSRVRKHNDGGEDEGFSKAKWTFVKGNSHDSEYYDIPIGMFRNFCLKDEYEMMNLRPYEENSFRKGELFLEPDDNLYGDSEPNRRVPVFKYETDNGMTISYWMFFGYNKATFKSLVDASHQGDWECVTVHLEKSDEKSDEKSGYKIVSASLSAHTGSNVYQTSDLQTTEENGKTVLTIYCAKGSHALFNKAGNHPHKVWKFEVEDYTDDAGKVWTITDKVIDLKSPALVWKYFTGAWGEVGLTSWTTGPLGPWPKCGGLDDDILNRKSPYLFALLSSTDKALLILDRATRDFLVENESDGIPVIGNEDEILFSRIHKGNENGQTTYRFSKLKAVDINGKPVKGKIELINRKWSEWHKQSDSQNFFMASDIGDEDKYSRVIIGRHHKGDENGDTRYYTAVVTFNGKKARVKPYPIADLIIYESTGKEVKPKANLVIIGIKHSGDENGMSTYCQGSIVVEG